MLQEIVISGFGGQGVLSMGKILAYSGIMVRNNGAAQPMLRSSFPMNPSVRLW